MKFVLRNKLRCRTKIFLEVGVGIKKPSYHLRGLGLRRLPGNTYLLNLFQKILGLHDKR